MTREPHVVLRTVAVPGTRDSYSGPLQYAGASAFGLPPRTLVESLDLTQDEVEDQARDPATVAICPVMPTALVEPVASQSHTCEEHDKGVTWGIRAVGAADADFAGSGVHVAVLDTGIDPSHPAFAGVDLTFKDFTDTNNRVPRDDNDHGTHCAGTILGRDVDGIRIGVARGISRLLVGKILTSDGRGRTDWMLAALNWALDSGARVISLSLGLDFPGLVARLVSGGWPTELATCRALEAYRANLRMLDAFMHQVRARIEFDGGAVVVAASGNESRRPEFASAALYL